MILPRCAELHEPLHPEFQSCACLDSKASSEVSVPSGQSEQVKDDCSRTRVEEVSMDHEIHALAIGMTRDSYWLGLPTWPIFAALKQHGLMQNIVPANCHDEAVSPLQPLSLPESLRPTPLQLVHSHQRWIDRFPFPRLRDNLIVLKGLVDLDKFIKDLFGMASLSFRFELQRATWDPASWKIEPEFATKWGYLFC